MMFYDSFKYFRAGNLLKEFIIEFEQSKKLPTGRVAKVHSGDGTNTLKGCLADATEEDKANHSINDHIVTHTIVQSGGPLTKRGDRLILDNRVFYVVDSNNIGSLGIATIYYVEERDDLR